MSTIGDIAVQAELHPSGRWVTIAIDIGPPESGTTYTIAAVLDTGAPVSGIRPRVEHELLARDLLRSSSKSLRYRLDEMTANHQPLPSLDVAVIRRLDHLGVDALLGLDFLTHFEQVHFHTRTLQLVLERA